MTPTVPALARAGETLIDLTAPTAEGDTHLEWAAAIARRIARWRGFKARTQEEAEVVAHAHYTLVRKLTQFAPLPEYGPGQTADGHFRGWVHMSLRAECLREAKRLRSGGTFRTPRRSEEVIVEPLPARHTDGGIEEAEIADHREPSPDYAEACASFKRKRRWSDETGEEIPEPLARAVETDFTAERLKELKTYVSPELLRLLAELDRAGAEPATATR